MPPIELVVASALVLAGLILAGVLFYRHRVNARIDAESAAHWQEMDRNHGWRAAPAEWPPPTPPQDTND